MPEELKPGDQLHKPLGEVIKEEFEGAWSKGSKLN
jgi:hypothetical protein